MIDNTVQTDLKPIYNIKAVARLVGLLPVTLRAWERRYGIPTPERGGQGYRLYSERDVRTLLWLKSQVDSGLNIGRAVEYLNDLRSNGRDPAMETVYRPTKPGEPRKTPTPLPSSPSIHRLYEDFLDTLLQFDEASAQEVLRRAFTLYSVEMVLVEVIEPALVTLGEAWHRGKLPIAVEHYATQVCMQHLMSMLSAAGLPTKPGTIVAACAPGEQHQVGLLMLVVMLRWRGWDVKYLGPDLSLERLEEALRPIHPQILMFSAMRPDTARRLEELTEILKKFAPSQPLVVLGGQAFQSIRLPETVPAVYIQSSPLETIEYIEHLMAQALEPNKPEQEIE